MIKTFVLISVMLLASSVNAVCETDLITALGLSAVTAAALTDLDYCANLQETGAQSCCSAATINAFQTDLEATITTLETAFGVRDVLIETARKTTVPALKEKYSTIATDARLVLTLLGDDTDYTTALPTITTIKNWNSNINTINSAGVAAYQAARTTCIRKLLKFQSAAWCLACDNSADSLGVTTGSDTVDLSPDAYEELSTACYGYLTYAEFHSKILYYALLDSTDLDTITTKLNDILDASGDAAILTAVNALVSAYEALPVNTETALTSVVEIPSGCEEDACPWIEDTVFNGGELDTTFMTIGGSEVLTARRLLQSIANSEGRMLAGTGTWAPSATASGATISVASNPGDVDTSSGLRQGALIGSILAVLAVLLF